MNELEAPRHWAIALAADEAANTLREQVWWLPLAISVLAFITSLFALGWQIRSFLLAGARVHVRLVPALWDPDSTRLFLHESKTGATDPETGVLNRGNRIDGVECALLIVENHGRTAVTISDPGVACRGKRRGLRRRQLYTVSPATFNEGEDGRFATSTAPRRLEPHSSVQYLLDIHAAINAVRQYRNGNLKAWGCVNQVGKRRIVLARRAWKIPKGARTIVRFEAQMTVERRIRLQLARDGHRADEYLSRNLAAKLAQLRRRGRLERDEAAATVTAALEGWAKMWGERPIVGITAFSIASALADDAESYDWTGAETELDERGAKGLYERDERSDLPDDRGREPGSAPDDGASDGLSGRVLTEHDARAGESGQDDEGGQPGTGEPSEQ